MLKKTDRPLSCVPLIFRRRGPTAFVRFLNLRKRRPAGFARGFLRLRKHRPTDPRAGVFLRARYPCTRHSVPRGRATPQRMRFLSPIRPVPCPSAGVPRSKETASLQDHTVGLCLGPYGGPRGGAVPYERGTPVFYPKEVLGSPTALR